MFYALSQPLTPLSPFLVRDRPRSEYADFLDDLREFISSRLDRVDPYLESEEYRRQQDRASRLHGRLLEILPEDGRTTLREYNEAMGAAHYLEVAMLSERAFLDGMRMILKALGVGADNGL